MRKKVPIDAWKVALDVLFFHSLVNPVHSFLVAVGHQLCLASAMELLDYVVEIIKPWHYVCCRPACLARTWQVVYISLYYMSGFHNRLLDKEKLFFSWICNGRKKILQTRWGSCSHLWHELRELLLSSLPSQGCRRRSSQQYPLLRPPHRHSHLSVASDTALSGLVDPKLCAEDPEFLLRQLLDPSCSLPYSDHHTARHQKSFNFRELCIRRVLETFATNTVKIYNLYASRDCTAMQDSIIHNFGPYSKALLRFARHQENQIRDKLQEPPGGFPVHRSYSFLLHNWSKSRADLQSRIKSSEYCMNLDQAIWLHLQVVVESQHILRMCNWITTLHVLRTSRSILRPDQHVLFLLQNILNKLPRWRSQPTRSHTIKKKEKKLHRNIESVSKNTYLTYLKATAPESKLTTTTTMSLFARFLLVVCCCCQREEKTISENQLPPWYEQHFYAGTSSNPAVISWESSA